MYVTKCYFNLLYLLKCVIGSYDLPLIYLKRCITLIKSLVSFKFTVNKPNCLR